MTTQFFPLLSEGEEIKALYAKNPGGLQSATAQAIASNGTISTSGPPQVGVARVSPAGAVTGVILQPGTNPGQTVWVVNEAAAANTVTMAAAATSNVADGTADVIPGGQAKLYVWDSLANSGAGYWFAYGQAVLTGGTLVVTQSATSPDPGAGGTIATAGLGVSRVTPASNRTGIILQAGTQPGQFVTVINEAASATLTFNTTPATANVADSATEGAIAGLTARTFVWDSATSLWYQVKGA
jgi:hypothetical protein